MLPLYDENPTYETPYVTYALIGANALVFLLLNLIEYTGGQYQLQQFYYDWAVVPQFVWNGDRLYTLITSQFMHHGVLHFGGNMLYLYIFGNNVEDSMGHKRFVLFYLICGVVASYTQIFIDTSSPIPMLGASGAIAGILGAYVVNFPRANVVTWALFLIIRIPAVIVLGFWILLQFFSGIGSLATQASGGVAYFAHIGGFVAGFFLVKLFTRRDYLSRKRRIEDWDQIYFNR
ncbi:MAG TPA: rhomboid family intramembrane serine protease [Methanomicrobia archaeon]|nr:rhomboid family intramembrane serine protease [Methanomicrobia archaeon]